jgi:hypothetical protein
MEKPLAKTGWMPYGRTQFGDGYATDRRTSVTMNWTNAPAAENSPGQRGRLGTETLASPGISTQPGASSLGMPGPGKRTEIRIGKCLAFSALAGSAKDMEVFTVTLGNETIELLPWKNWHQLDHHKWTVQGKLPAAPAGLEVAADHVRIMGGTVAINDPAGCVKLEQLFNEWLHFERETLELARKKAQSHTSPAGASAAQPGAQPLRFHVEMDKRGQVHVQCIQGKETLASVGLSIAGITSLHQQGLMRKPRALATGALHDWLELDGELCSFENGRNDAARLEQILNERYLPDMSSGRGKEVNVYLNPASSTGFDIQFPVTVGGVPDNHRHHLNERSLELLQDPGHCGLLHKEIIVKLIPPNLVFKRKTPDGGEQYLAWSPENTVLVADEEGSEKTLQLSQPLNLMRLSPAELTAVFNHPAINRHTQAAPQGQASGPPARPAPPASVPAAPSAPAKPTVSLKPEPQPEPVRDLAEPKPMPPARPTAPPTSAGHSDAHPIGAFRSLPNVWLKDILAEPALPQDWFAVLTYTRMAEHFGNSNEGQFGPSDCWYISLGEKEDIADPEFRGILITEKGSLGYLSGGQMARFYNRVAFIGPQDSALEGIAVDLVAVGLDAYERVVFVLSDNYRGQFGVRAATVGEVLNRLRENGAVILGIKELLANPDPIEVLWTVPAAQEDPSTPVARESTPPGSTGRGRSAGL